MNLILQDVSAATAAQGNLAQGVAGTAVAGNASASSANGASGQGACASTTQDNSAFGDILGQVQSLLSELAPANAQQAASASHAEQPLPSMTPPAANGSAEPAAALPADVESSLPAFMPATMPAHGKQAGAATEGAAQDSGRDAAAPAAVPMPPMFMLNASMPAVLPGRPAVGTGNVGSGSTVGDGQGRASMDASSAIQLGVAQAADARGGALTAADTHVAAAMAASTGDQPTQGAADASSVAALVAQLPGGNPQAATAPDTLRLPNGDPSQWRQTLGEALGDRIVLQRDKGSDQATIRLDPPAMGQIEISIRHEAGALKVSIAATHTEVLNQLRGVGEALRQDLEQKHQGEVTVQLSQSGSRLSGDDNRGGSGGREQPRREPGRALTDENGEATAGFHLEGSEA